MISSFPICRKRKCCDSLVSDEPTVKRRLVLVTSIIGSSTLLLTTTTTIPAIAFIPIMKLMHQTITGQIALELLMKHEELRKIETDTMAYWPLWSTVCRMTRRISYQPPKKW
ncbi:hypothetical protein N7495_007093 [Penicillium taxi]|uniref:uncharacterized protein n=1 Tax=Penicillium taxi TaxID=168475 RepID=UPI0025455949|nr:uncharacterized protein N7495_007093 [Penicillium taxi]KAJ5895402.1 hypothetical protein N7495_007093 [Penicillium taxi]